MRNVSISILLIAVVTSFFISIMLLNHRFVVSLIILIISALLFYSMKTQHKIDILIFITLLLLSLPFTVATEYLSSITLVMVRALPIITILLTHLIAPLKNRRIAVANRIILTIYIPVIAFAIVATVPNTQWIDGLVYILGGLLFLMTLLSYSIQIVNRSSIVCAYFIGIISISLIVAILFPSVGIEAGRVRGVFENANGLGFISFIGGSFAVYSNLGKIPKIVLMLVAPAAIAFAASRASMLALGIVLLIYFVRTRPLLSSILISIILLYVATGPKFLDIPFLKEGILRTNDSRAAGEDVAYLDWNSNYWFGVGLGNESDIIASTPFRALSNGGIIGLLIIITLYILLIVMTFIHYRNLFPFTLAAITHSLFEGWFLSSVSPLLAIFTITFIVLSEEQKKKKHLNSKLNDHNRVSP